MPTQRFYIRLILEIIGIVAITEIAAMFALPIVAPSSASHLRSALDAALLSLVAGPLIAWRVRGWIAEAKQHFVHGAELSLREQTESLALTTALARAEDVPAAAAAVMASIVRTTGIERCAVLLYPGRSGDGVCRFVGSLGLSLEYQSAVQGHCPWREGQPEAHPILVENVATEASLAKYSSLFAREAIGTVAFIPVMTDEGVAGKLMLYHAKAGAITQRMAEGALVAGGFLGVTVARLRAQANTRESENLFRLLVEGGDEFVNLMSTDRKALYVSPSYHRLTGWTADDLKNSDFTTRIHPEDLEMVLKAREANLAGRATRIEYRALKKDGSAIWLDLRATPVLDDAGAMVTRILCFSRDITESKLVEQRIRESEQRMRAIIDGTGVIAWEFDFAAGRFTYVSPQAAMFGYPLDHWMQPGFWQSHIHPDDRDTAIATCMGESKAGKNHRFQYRLMRADGEPVWVDDSVSVEVQGGEVVKLRGVLIDITERREAERRLQESEQRMRAIIDGTDVIAWEFDFAADRYTYVSPQAAKMGYPIQDWMTPGFWDQHVHPDDLPAALKKCLEEAHAGRCHRNQYRMVRADGSHVWVDDFVSVEMRGDKPGTLRGVLIDISESRRLRDLAEAANAAKSEFLANMSHEIRTPLTAILGYTELLVEDGDLSQAPRRRVENLSTIKRAGEHLLTVVNDILDLSKIEAGRLEVEEVESDLPGVLGEVGSLMGARAKEKGIALQIKLGSLLPVKAMTDPTRLRQILLNLVGNAVKFTDQGKVEVTATVAHSVLCVDVEDTGPGLSECQVEKLFVPFAQADTSVTRKHGGTGLGLTICRRLAALMGGSVTLHRTTPGQGSTFRVSLPLRVPADTPWTEILHMVTEEALVAPPMTLSGRILLAEDGEDNQRLIAFHLKKSGAQVEIAENGRIALDMIEQAGEDGYDILLTDMQMPEVDGYTLARTLRERGSRVPIIALTAHAMAEDRRKCLEAGCDDYASKPIERAALIATCAAWIGKQGGQAKRLAA